MGEPMQKCVECDDLFDVEGYIVASEHTETGIEDVVECPSCGNRQLVDEKTQDPNIAETGRLQLPPKLDRGGS